MMVDDFDCEARHFLRREPRRKVDADRLLVELGDERVGSGRAELSRCHKCC